MLRRQKGDGHRTIEENREIEVNFELEIDQCQAGMNQVQQKFSSNGASLKCRNNHAADVEVLGVKSES